MIFSGRIVVISMVNPKSKRWWSKMSLRFTQFGMPSHLAASWGAQQGAGPDILRGLDLELQGYVCIVWYRGGPIA